VEIWADAIFKAQTVHCKERKVSIVVWVTRLRSSHGTKTFKRSIVGLGDEVGAPWHGTTMVIALIVSTRKGNHSRISNGFKIATP
jgi:hypothetical protein